MSDLPTAAPTAPVETTDIVTLNTDAISSARPIQRREHVPIVNGTLKPDSLDGVWRIAQMLFATKSMIPANLQKPEDVVHAILFGQELGLSPLQSVQAVMVVNNRPTVWGDAAIGLVRSSGKCLGIEETITQTNPDGSIGDDCVAICRVKRRHMLAGGAEEIETIERQFTVADAKAAGLWTKAGPWRQYPKRMLQMRARSWALRDAFADILRGVGIREEVEDMTFDPSRMTGVRREVEVEQPLSLPQDTRHTRTNGNGRSTPQQTGVDTTTAP